jgi:hypothetical protein
MKGLILDLSGPYGQGRVSLLETSYWQPVNFLFDEKPVEYYIII